MSDFAQRRRQQFLTPAFYAATQDFYGRLFAGLTKELEESSLTAEDRSLLWQNLAGDGFEEFVLRYTAGAPIEPLRAELEKVIEAHERWQEALAAFERIPQIAPLGLDRIAEYQRCMQLIGLCFLLHRRDLLPRIAKLEDPGYAGTDALYEDLLDYELPNRLNIDKLYHGKPYTPLVQAMYRESDAESLADIKAYCQAWYPAMKRVPWHDGHLRMTDTDGDYFGYWAFEAGAVAYLLELDDSSLDHMVYPKDLVKFAREFEPQAGSSTQQPSERLRGDAGQPCPREGWWFTPAKAGSRRHFRLGEVMPAFTTDYGATLWQWDEQQGG